MQKKQQIRQWATAVLRDFAIRGYVLAHKTDSSGTVGGSTLGHNDVGIIRLPDDRYACIVSFITACTEDSTTLNHAHAQLAEMTYSALTDK